MIVNDLPCTKCFGQGWVYAGFNGLFGPVMWITKDGEQSKLQCDVCHGRGIVAGIPGK